jgi:hypothetical protein
MVQDAETGDPVGKQVNEWRLSVKSVSIRKVDCVAYINEDRINV